MVFYYRLVVEKKEWWITIVKARNKLLRHAYYAFRHWYRCFDFSICQVVALHRIQYTCAAENVCFFMQNILETEAATTKTDSSIA